MVELTTLINACIRLNYIPDAWKIDEVIMISKPGKNLSEVESYRPISLLPIISKLFGKLILNRLKLIIAEKHLVPTHQFGFGKNHSKIYQVHRITDIIEKLLKTKACALLSFLTLYKLSTEYGIEAYFIN
jgi:predicted metallopeptidase